MHVIFYYLCKWTRTKNEWMQKLSNDETKNIRVLILFSNDFQTKWDENAAAIFYFSRNKQQTAVTGGTITGGGSFLVGKLKYQLKYAPIHLIFPTIFWRIHTCLASQKMIEIYDTLYKFFLELENLNSNSSGVSSANAEISTRCKSAASVNENIDHSAVDLLMMMPSSCVWLAVFFSLWFSSVWLSSV